MSAPVIVPRAEHQISRREIDPEALKVLYRLHEHRYVAYLVGGSVRDLLLGRRPKDFDIGTDAHPYQIKKLFRNCWIIGRRFRLAHVKFGPKTIEVATFRRIVPDAPPDAAGPGPTDPATLADSPDSIVVATAGPEADGHTGARQGDEPLAADPHEHGIIHRDNTFGTPEEDAFRRDFTINGLFYDIATFSVIDFVGGLRDLEQRVIRSIGDPRVRFVEDPVRMLRAAVMSARLDFELDPLVLEAIAEHRQLIAKAAAPRLMEEYFKILRSGAAEATFQVMSRLGLLGLITPELEAQTEAVWDYLARLDRYRQRFPSAPPELTNTILIGVLLAPLGILDRYAAAGHRREDSRSERVSFGILPVARRDVDRLRQVLQLVPKMLDPTLPPRVARTLTHRPGFDDALAWLEIFCDAPEMVEHWTTARLERSHEHGHGHAHPHAQGPAVAHGAADAAPAPEDEAMGSRPNRRRRRRRRRRQRPEV